ncbi:methanol dehydrogenase subunit beta [Methylophaga lonarensis MPL]|uniref:Methanol dehydrogenase [cytochrome c] subunit 2 n=1 Tax=Methylophaga lonarensis MPL TaxID=1286106 RepID=M7NSZ0_9GAMM|nr:methanol dehydrogenase [cytochrome c] subunit [Methylophaga lonarensis]EMR11883.1 methanol dehydrogenase subunit beta [Methylophaga lonarensis MPL]
MKKLNVLAAAGSAALMLAMGTPAIAYDGTQCRAPGDCWQAKPGFPEKIEGSKYDPKHSEVELNKQTQAMNAMEERNRKRAENFKKTGTWNY